MAKVRAAQLMNVRKKFHNEILIKIIKNKVSQKSFETVTEYEPPELTWNCESVDPSCH